jgi:predicted O-linked N-acetylglucosamine transferase (SPINDLY family)
MGVPLLAIQTDWMGGRMSSSTLTALGHVNWIAREPEAFATNAAQLATEILSQPHNLFKHKLRQKFLDSPLSDGASLCRALEQVFIKMVEERSRN